MESTASVIKDEMTPPPITIVIIIVHRFELYSTTSAVRHTCRQLGSFMHRFWWFATMATFPSELPDRSGGSFRFLIFFVFFRFHRLIGGFFVLRFVLRIIMIAEFQRKIIETTATLNGATFNPKIFLVDGEEAALPRQSSPLAPMKPTELNSSV
uniref:Uncharacterized protein n=1 Tax=Anopheles farauti TaxID=69004 RepID=A0A182QED9_9DIPT